MDHETYTILLGEQFSKALDNHNSTLTVIETLIKLVEQLDERLTKLERTLIS